MFELLLLSRSMVAGSTVVIVKWLSASSVEHQYNSLFVITSDYATKQCDD